MEFLERNIISKDLFTFLFVGVFISFTFLRNIFPKRFIEFLKLPITDKYFYVEGKDNAVYHPFNICLFIIQIVAFSMVAYFWITQKPKFNFLENKWLFLQLFTAFGIFATGKYFIEKILAVLMNVETILDRFLYEKLSYTNLIAVLILLFCFFINYSPIHFEASTSLLILLIISLYALVIFSIVKRNTKVILGHFFYFILYLCALEIAPYIILYKLVV